MENAGVFIKYFLFLVIGLAIIIALVVLASSLQSSRSRDITLVPTHNLATIDFVVTWVDASDLVWRKKRNRWAGGNSNSKNDERRYGQGIVTNLEIETCVRSILKYAPWCNRVWIVTDNQIPRFYKELSRSHRHKVTIIDHNDFFINRSDLPTFNSHTIEANLHNINGLSERFIYMNDDNAFTSYVSPEHFFEGDMPVYRSSFVGTSPLTRKILSKIDPSSEMFLTCTSNLNVYSKGIFTWRYPHHAVPLCRSFFSDRVVTRIGITTYNICSSKFRDISDIPPIHCAVLQALDDKRANIYNGEIYQTLFAEKLSSKHNLREYHEVCFNNITERDDAKTVQDLASLGQWDLH